MPLVPSLHARPDLFPQLPRVAQGPTVKDLAVDAGLDAVDVGHDGVATGLDGMLARLAEGERGVAAELFRALWPPVRRLAGAMLGNDADADDAAQDAMVTIFARVGDYDRRRPALPWALAVAAWSCRTVRKRRVRRREEGLAAAPVAVAGERPDHDAEQRELVDAAMRALSSLSEVDRETLVSTYWEEQASATGATLRKRRERALDRLRGMFRRIYGLG